MKRFTRFVTWVTGRKPGNKEKDLSVKLNAECTYKMRGYPPELTWLMAITGDFHSFTIGITVAPNVFHRAMQRLMLGIRYKMIEE